MAKTRGAGRGTARGAYVSKAGGRAPRHPGGRATVPPRRSTRNQANLPEASSSDSPGAVKAAGVLQSIKSTAPAAGSVGRTNGPSTPRNQKRSCSKPPGHWSAEKRQRRDGHEETAAAGLEETAAAGLRPTPQTSAAGERRSTRSTASTRSGGSPHSSSGVDGVDRVLPAGRPGGSSSRHGASQTNAQGAAAPGGRKGSDTSAASGSRSSASKKSASKKSAPNNAARKDAGGGKAGSKKGMGEKAWMTANPSVGLEVCPKILGTNKRDEKGGIVLLEEIAKCSTTVPEGKGFEDITFKGYSDRAFRHWVQHILVNVEARLRQNQEYKGNPKLWVHPGSYRDIYKWVESQKQQYSDALNSHNKTGSEANYVPKSALQIARDKVSEAAVLRRVKQPQQNRLGSKLCPEVSPADSPRQCRHDIVAGYLQG